MKRLAVPTTTLLLALATFATAHAQGVGSLNGGNVLNSDSAGNIESVQISNKCCSIWDFLGVKQAGSFVSNYFCKSNLGQAVSGFFGPFAKAFGLGPSVLSPKFAKEGGVMGLANKLKEEEAKAPLKVQAIEYLATLDCNCYPEIVDALLASLDDCSEMVRFAALKALRKRCCGASGCRECDKCVGDCQGCQCQKKVIDRLNDLLLDRDESGCLKEKSPRIRCLATTMIEECLARRQPPPYLVEDDAPVPPKKAQPDATPKAVPDAPPKPIPDSVQVTPNSAAPAPHGSVWSRLFGRPSSSPAETASTMQPSPAMPVATQPTVTVAAKPAPAAVAKPTLPPTYHSASPSVSQAASRPSVQPTQPAQVVAPSVVHTVAKPAAPAWKADTNPPAPAPMRSSVPQRTSVVSEVREPVVVQPARMTTTTAPRSVAQEQKNGSLFEQFKREQHAEDVQSARYVAPVEMTNRRPAVRQTSGRRTRTDEVQVQVISSEPTLIGNTVSATEREPVEVAAPKTQPTTKSKTKSRKTDGILGRLFGR